MKSSYQAIEVPHYNGYSRESPVRFGGKIVEKIGSGRASGSRRLDLASGGLVVTIGDIGTGHFLGKVV